MDLEEDISECKQRHQHESGRRQIIKNFLDFAPFLFLEREEQKHMCGQSHKTELLLRDGYSCQIRIPAIRSLAAKLLSPS